MSKKYILYDSIFIIVAAIILVILSEFGLLDIVSIYAIPFLYGSFVLGRYSVKLRKKQEEKDI